MVETNNDWFDFYGKDKPRNVVYPNIGDNVQFLLRNGLLLNGEFVDYHSVGKFWAYNWGYFEDDDVIQWRIYEPVCL